MVLFLLLYDDYDDDNDGDDDDNADNDDDGVGKQTRFHYFVGGSRDLG